MRMLPLILLLILAGCGEIRYQSNPKTGEMVKAPSFSSLEEGIYHSISSELEREVKGKPPSAGAKTWRAYWEWRISLWRKENDRKYEDYLYRRRKELKLENHFFAG